MKSGEGRPKNAAELINDREAASQLPAVYVDGWFTTTWEGHMRIAVSERTYDEDRYRFAFIMELDDVEKFAQHLLGEVTKRRKREEEEEEES